MIIVVGFACCLPTFLDWNDTMNIFLVTAMYGAIAIKYAIYCDSLNYAITVSNDNNTMADSITVCEM